MVFRVSSLVLCLLRVPSDFRSPPWLWRFLPRESLRVCGTPSHKCCPLPFFCEKVTKGPCVPKGFELSRQQEPKMHPFRFSNAPPEIVSFEPEKSRNLEDVAPFGNFCVVLNVRQSKQGAGHPLAS